jgi:hypothetical protein
VKATAARKVSVANKAASNLDTFKAEFPAEMAWIDSRISWEVKTGKGDFGSSLRDGVIKFGGLTEKQMAAVRTNMAKRAEAIAAAPAKSTVIDVTNLDAVFAVARSQNAIKAALRTGTITFSLAKAGGANPGAIYAKTADGEYLGKIVGGTFHKAMACTPANVEEVIEASRDPKAAAIRYATATNRCSVCNIVLTDPVSKERKMGPDCAKKFGW